MIAHILEFYHLCAEIFVSIPAFVFAMYAFMFALIALIAIGKLFEK